MWRETSIYTDGWPRFTTVVFQCTFPRLSDIADLNCHSTSKDGFWLFSVKLVC